MKHVFPLTFLYDSHQSTYSSFV